MGTNKLPFSLRPLVLATCAAPVAIVFSLGVYAQQIEEVTVTAQKRAESAQDVPISVNAITGDQIRASGAGNLEGLSDSIPNVDIADSPGVTRVVIRGLGSGTGNAAFEQSVGMFVDGIYASRAALFQAPFLDVERVEVLKGPQGVLFGKNSIAGALSLVSNRPTESFDAEISASYDFEYGSRELTGFASGPVADGLYARVAARVSDEAGYMDNALSDEEVPATEMGVVRAMLLWEPGPDTEVLVKVESSKLNENGTNWQVFADYSEGTFPYQLKNVPGYTPPSQSLALGAASYLQSSAAGEDFIYDDTAYINEIGHLDQDADNVTLEMTHQLGEYELVYLLGYGKYDREQFSDQDFTAAGVANNLAIESFEQVSHEFRIASPQGNVLDYIAGLYFLDRTLSQDAYQDGFGSVPALSFSTDAGYEEDSTSYAAFGQVTWNIADDWRASLGLRYSKEDKDASNSRFNRVYQSEQSLAENDPYRYAVVGALLNRRDFAYHDERSEENLDPALNIQWDFNESSMAYLSWVKASKAGGFNTNETGGDLDNFSFEPESAKSIEAGIKTDFLGGRARLNTAVFRTEFDDLQVGAFDSTANGFVVKNAAKAVSQGVELEGLFALTDSVMIGGTTAYLNAEYRDFSASCPNNWVQAAKLDCYQNPNGPTGNMIQDLDGVQLDNAPKVTAALFADYSRQVMGNLLFGTRLDASYKGETSLDFSQDENLFADAYWRLNLRASLASEADTWDIALTAFNLTDEQPATFGGQEFLLPGVYWLNRARGREVELSLTYRFGQ